jgi:uncharacterized membrane protein
MAINAAGQVIGEADTGETVTMVVSDPSGVTSSTNGAPPPPGPLITVTRPVSHACLWQNGMRIDLGLVVDPNHPAGQFSRAIALNDAGQIVVQRDGPDPAAFLLTPQ